MFQRLGTKILFSTVWHLQTDGVLERTNQVIEIAFRYYIAALEDTKKWPEILARLSAALSNSTSRGTGQPSTVVLYSFRIWELLDAAAQDLVDIGLEGE
jgi:hypothetical protein